MRLGLVACALVLLVLGQVTERLDGDERSRQARSLLAGEGVEVVGTAVSVRERERLRLRGRSTTTVRERCGDFDYRVPGRSDTFSYDASEQDGECGSSVQVGDTVELVVDPAQPDVAYETSGVRLTAIDRAGWVPWLLHGAGGALLLLAVLASLRSGRRHPARPEA